jgi:hypothetical protein
MRKFQSPVGLMVLLAIATMIGFIATVVTGKLESFIDGIIVEMFGAFVTAGAIIGLEQILTYDERIKQGQEIARLQKQLEKQTQQLNALLTHFDIPNAPTSDSTPSTQQ